MMKSLRYGKLFPVFVVFLLLIFSCRTSDDVVQDSDSETLQKFNVFSEDSEFKNASGVDYAKAFAYLLVMTI